MSPKLVSVRKLPCRRDCGDLRGKIYDSGNGRGLSGFSGCIGSSIVRRRSLPSQDITTASGVSPFSEKSGKSENSAAVPESQIRPWRSRDQSFQDEHWVDGWF